jgi:hypothetical protein
LTIFCFHLAEQVLPFFVIFFFWRCTTACDALHWMQFAALSTWLFSKSLPRRFFTYNNINNIVIYYY